ncbi:HK97 family phage prohead protease [Bacillus subtilis]|uniref:HK97 family phage prohead protease n=1 Tax=Bacillus subtilis TaxID=1423 RepID=UPI00129E97CF|nr:HK97 family phage prohead protease [Bacillus subtilis]CAF1775229.1 hypothetical protein NRS6092_04114 [Bacillus subtilis]CAF1785832.1 hypothetical protein NRS6108_04201 [Bacillus subtilis]CAF1851721.1 hypothetical protein NRS6134_04005 [Bacillus subtilis]CAI6330262.1 HK97 family phage major capsid protein [Bacillus subtilis]
MKFELLSRKVELRANNDNDSMTVSGYVNKTGELSEVLGSGKKFVEKIAPGAFTRALSRNPNNIDFLAEHNSKHILASTRNGSLRLFEDNTGLYMEATISPTTWGHDYYQLIEDKILRNMSFGFRTLDDSWDVRDDGIYERTINDLELLEVSVVRDPAYSQSTISARGIDVIEDIEVPTELEEGEQRNMDEIKELFEGLEERLLTSLKESINEIRSEQKEFIEQATAELREKVNEQDPEKDTENSGEQTEVKDNNTEQDEPETKDKPENVDETKPDEKDPKEDKSDEDPDGEKKRSLVSEELSELRNKLTGLSK